MYIQIFTHVAKARVSTTLFIIFFGIKYKYEYAYRYYALYILFTSITVPDIVPISTFPRTFKSH